MTNLDNSQKAALCSSIRTSKYSKKIVSLLRDISDDLYKTDRAHGLKAFEGLIDDDLFIVLKEILKDTDIDNPMLVEKKLHEVIDYLKGIEEITFIVPVHPSNDFLKRLHSWCSENITPEILLEFSTNRLMDSGLLMVYKGHYFMYSLENLLDEYFTVHDLSTKLLNNS